MLFKIQHLEYSYDFDTKNVDICGDCKWVTYKGKVRIISVRLHQIGIEYVMFNSIGIGIWRL